MSSWRDPADSRHRIIPGFRSVAPADSQPEFHVVIIDPMGRSFDVTDRLGKSSIGRITETTEEGFLELVHGDVEVELDNQDGAMTRYFLGVTPTDLYQVLIHRKARTGSILHWERIFGGALDLPWSLRTNHSDRIVSLTVYSFHKLLERVSGETVARTITGRTGSVTAATKSVTVNDATDIKIGDEVQLRDATNEESQIVRSVSGVTLGTVDAWSNTFSSAELTVLTPFHRNKSPQALADLIFGATGIVSTQVDIIPKLSAHGIATPANPDGLGRKADSLKLQDVLTYFMPKSTVAPGVFELEWHNGIQPVTSPGPTEPWTAQAVGGTNEADWTRYLDDEPATFPSLSGNADQGFLEVTDHTNNKLGFLSPAGTTPVTSVAIDHTDVVGGPTLVLGGSANLDKIRLSVEIDPVSGFIWGSVTGKTGDTDVTFNPNGWNVVKVLDPSGPTVHNVDLQLSGKLVYIRRLTVMALHEMEPGSSEAGEFTTNLHLYDPATRVKLRTVQVPKLLWAFSLRAYRQGGQDRIAGLYESLGTTRMRIWDFDWNQIADFEVSDTAPVEGDSTYHWMATWLTVLPVGNEEWLIGHTSGEVFVVAKGYAGVIPYADFTGLSCAGAMREVALATMSYMEVDPYKTGRLTSRLTSNPIRQLNARELDEPLNMESWPIWEFYRTSVLLTGQNSAGDEITALKGDTGDSQHRMELKTQIIQTTALLEAVALMYVSLLNQQNAQQEVETVEPGDRMLHVFDYVRLQGTLYAMIEVVLEPMSREYKLRLVQTEGV